MIKIGITGASGILGTSLIYFLKKKPKYKIKKYNYDVLNVKKIENWIKYNQFQVIIHLAALVPVRTVEKKYKLAKKINIEGTKNLVNAIKKYQKIKPFLFFSSTSHVYSYSTKIFTEKDKIIGVTKYGKTKIKAETILLQYKNFYNLCIGRISSMISENQNTNFLINKIIKLGKRGNQIIFKNSNIKRNFIYVDDVSKIIIKIIEKKIIGILNISGSKTTHLFKLFLFIEKKYNFKIDHSLKNFEYLIVSNKLLLKKIGNYKFISIQKILAKIYRRVN